MRRVVAGLALCLALLVAPAVAQAVDIQVNTTRDEFGEDPTACSLREALVAAQNDASLGGCGAGSGNDTILLPGGNYLITRAGAGEESGSSGDFDITGADNLEIRPTGPTERVVVDGNGLDRVFDKHGAGEVTIKSIRIRGGKLTEIEDGGGMRVSGAGGAFLENVTVDDNETAYQGGGIAVYSYLHLTNSTISGNRAGGSGGGFYAPGGSLVQARSTTIANNQADADGNGSGIGGGFSEAVSISVSFTNVLNVGNSAAPPVGDERNNDCSSGNTFYPRFSLQSQLFGPLDCEVAADPGTNRVAFDPQIGPLGYHGGQTPTHNLLKGAIAIGNGGTVAPDACPPIDQNGVGRLAGSCDIGSTTYLAKPVLKIVNIKPKGKAIRRGKSKAFKVVVRNSGDTKAERVNVCLVLPKAAKKALARKGSLCKRIKAINIGARKSLKIKLRAKPKAARKKFKVQATAKTSNTNKVKKAFKVKVK